jgi:hypothetical protein
MLDERRLHICLLHTNKADGEPLQLSTGEKANVTIRNLVELCFESV